jgi:DNA-binding NarL/FixJ family response regulator
MEEIKLVLVDDKAYNIQVLEEKLASKPEVRILFTACNGADFLNKLNDSTDLPQVVFMDIDMPEMNGIEAVLIAKAKFPSIQFVMITIFDDDEKVFKAIQSGASGYLLKDESASNIHRAIDDIMIYGGAPMSPQIARKAFQFIQSQAPQKQDELPLSSREMDILRELAEGKNYIAVAEKLFISPHTVRKHMTNIYDKLYVHSKVEAVTMAMNKGWIR